jgi:polygalacturonase
MFRQIICCSLVVFTLGLNNLWLPPSASGFYPDAILNVLEFGAVPDNSTLNTIAISKAISTADSLGGGIVVFPPGAYYTGAINLTSNVYLYLQSGAFIQASNKVEDYPYDWDLWDVVHAENVVNCGIIGDGLSSILSGPMWQMIEGYDAEQNQIQPIIWTGVNGCQGECRPRGIVFVDAVNVTISNFWLRDSADWSSLFRRVTNLMIDNITITGSLQWPNNDGIDLESGTNMTLSNLNISTGDDGIVFVSGNTNNMNTPWPEEVPYTPLSKVLVTNCHVQSHSGALKFEAIFQYHHGDIYDIVIENSIVHSSNRGIGFQQRTGEGIWKNIMIRNITVESMFITGTNWWGTAEGIYMTSIPEGDQTQYITLGGIKNVTFEDITVRAENTALISNRDQEVGIVSDIYFNNVQYTIAKMGNETRPLHDYRPLDESSPSESTYPFYVEGFYIEDVTNIVFNNSIVRFEGPSQSYWNDGSCVNATTDSIVKYDNFHCFASDE